MVIVRLPAIFKGHNNTLVPVHHTRCIQKKANSTEVCASNGHDPLSQSNSKVLHAATFACWVEPSKIAPALADGKVALVLRAKVLLQQVVTVTLRRDRSAPGRISSTVSPTQTFQKEAKGFHPARSS